eukprot:TRINITY_DN479_c6_g1_i1.p1 TRINITY_DN479_c6_g1~~TRINITY_DN479_c6_g1_i1.p1  ORF type:complete len:520 (+),score=81.57 TRINITY_DN479_c6_g1_i1:90-1649(+)
MSTEANLTNVTELKKRSESPALRKRTGATDQEESKSKPEAARPSKHAEKSMQPWVLARTVQCYLLLGTRMVQQSMRNALSPLLVFMSQELDISTSQKGVLLSAIAAGYFFTQVPGGALADKLGAKNVMSFALALSAMCCFAAPVVVDAYGAKGLWFVMASMGAVQGPLFPTSTVYLSKWMPKKVEGGTDEKAWGTSMLDVGISVGALLVIPLVNTLAVAVGWRSTYHIIGGLSMAFVLLWHLLAAEEPRKCFFISRSELEFLEANIAKPQPNKLKVEPEDSEKPEPKEATKDNDSPGLLGLPMSIATHSSLWAVFYAHIAFNYGAYYLTNWSPTYYAEVLKISPAEAKYHLMMPHITNLAAKSLNPLLVKCAERCGFSLLGSRKLFTASGFALSALALLPVHQLRHWNPFVSTVLFSLANACFGLAPSGFKSNYLDITEKYVGVISGYGNTLGTVASWVGPQLVAYFLHEFQSWDVVLASVAIVNFLAALNYVRAATVTPLEQLVAAKDAPYMSVSKTK